MTETRVGRRRFLATGSALAGILVAASEGPDASPSVIEPRAARPGSVPVASGVQLGTRALIVYASAAGSTAETARFIGERLSQRGWVVDVRDARQSPSPQGYSAVIIGSAIRAGRWLSEATGYVKKHRLDLARTRTAYFTMCMTLHEDTAANRKTAADYIRPEREMLEPRTSAIFAGKMDYARLSFFARQMVKLKKVPEGDSRDWRRIGEWVDLLDRELAARG